MLLSLVREPDNRFDRHAVKIIAPPVEQLNPTVRNTITRERDRQRAKDVAGKCIGRLPKKISEFISNRLLNGDVKHCEAMFTGKIGHS